MSSTTQPSDAVAFGALGDATRLELLSRLGIEGAATATRLADALPVTRQAVSRHLRVLEDAGFLRSTKHGRDVLYAVDPAALQERGERLTAMSRAWDRRLHSIKERAETQRPGP